MLSPSRDQRLIREGYQCTWCRIKPDPTARRSHPAGQIVGCDERLRNSRSFLIMQEFETRGSTPCLQCSFGKAPCGLMVPNGIFGFGWDRAIPCSWQMQAGLVCCQTGESCARVIPPVNDSESISKGEAPKSSPGLGTSIFKAQRVWHTTVFQWQSSNWMTQDLGLLQLLTFLLIFCLLILLIQRIQVLKWMYFSWSVYCKVLRHNLICNGYLDIFALFQLFDLIEELIFTSWWKLCNE